MTTETLTADRAEALLQRILDESKELSSSGMKSDAIGLAAAAILSARLIKALERIELLEGNLDVLTSMMAELEGKQ